MNHIPPMLSALTPAPPLLTTSVRLEPGTIERIDAFAASIGTGRGPVLRALVHAGMEQLTPSTPEVA